MPFYNRIDASTLEGRRTAERLLNLKIALDAIPDKTVDENLLLCTWNIRDFDKPAYGDRLDESIYYIAEIISKFDIVAIQEVYKDLRALDRVLTVLGSYWKYIVTDMSGGSRGNKERMTFLYDSRKVRFGGLAGEMVLPRVRLEDGTMVDAEQVWRTPFICGFKAGWSRFMLASVHIMWGSSTAAPADRVEEIGKVARFMRKRTENPTAWSRNLILLGDFNIFNVEDETFAQLTEQGFMIPEELQEFETNAGRNRHYDQIAFRIQRDRLDWTENCGVFDYFQHVFREADEALYVEYMGDAYRTKRNGTPRNDAEKRTYYRTYWRTHQMSDHLPMWVELKIDYSQRYLRKKLDDA
jgi:endonuclease/exonuclease/phosphatase family metal-dependent hydrolase